MSTWRAPIAFLACLMLAPVWSQELGRDYTQLTVAQPPTTPGKIEVLEFFSWGCSHCAQMHPLIEQWERDLPDNAVLVKVPISLGHRAWGQLVRAYYALDSLGELQRLEGAVFEALHRDRQPLFNEDHIVAWAASQGVDEARFREAFRSPEVSARALRAEELARGYRVNQTPQIVVQGRYVVLGRTHAESLTIARQLIDKVAAE
ncbi:MAG TPA: thiol:disulfide interchange protein DsbA/DsbL [Steroidobacter sp.]|jgi:thiol:disulfide interchange protein DsbA|nr:thiol:disulfide interchange protein DsbA/DsbL [Steroidobacteraceae bacterium]HLS80486.1 thiol:disulfide interchange protein DsbA/DsbL [Steroidobacter sp.]